MPLKFTKEQVEQLHAKIIAEFLRRNIHHYVTDKLDEVSFQISVKTHISVNLEETLLPISQSGIEKGEEITLSEVLEIFSKPFYLKRPLIYLYGGITNWSKSKGDIDIQIDYGVNHPERDTALEFRLGRALADAGEKFNGRQHIMYRKLEGPFTNYVPLYDLICVPSQYRNVIKMSELVGWLQNQIAIADIKDARAKHEAEQSRKHDEVSPMKFMLVCKPQIGHAPGEKYNWASFFTIVKEDQYPFSIEKKYDGVVLVFMKEGDNIIIRTEKGIDVTSMLPETVKELKTWPHTFTIISDSEMWEKGEYVGREFVGTYLMSKYKPDDSKIVHNVFEILYFYDPKVRKYGLNGTKGDLHELPYDVRRKYLDLLPFNYSTTQVPPVEKGHFNKVPLFQANNRKELESLSKKLAKAPASEGVVIKSLKGIHPLTGFNRTWYKMKTTSDIDVIVLKINTTKRPNVFTYRTGVAIPHGLKAKRTVTIGNREYMDIGKTFATVDRYKVGDVVVLNFEELFYYLDPESEETQLIAYVSHIIMKSEKANPLTMEEAILVAEHDKTLRKKTEALSYVSMEVKQ
jgi:hypothetical protein